MRTTGEDIQPLKQLDQAHHVSGGSGFTNPWSSWKEKTFLDIVKWWCYRKNPFAGVDEAALEKHYPVRDPDMNLLHKSQDNDEVRVLWIGHSTFLIQIDGVNLLTDPVFVERCSPIRIAGPKRYRPTPCSIPDLPKIHAVLLSHNHYDHLSSTCTQQLKEHHDPVWFVPLGHASWFASAGITKVVEREWWESAVFGEKLKVVLFPVQHWSLRTGLDRCKMLWGGWGVESIKTNMRVFFAGDTGYSDIFKEIGNVWGEIDLALLPIGAYEPYWFMGPQHVNPEEAVQISLDIKARQSVAMHFGTFALTGESVLEPPERLRAELKARNIDSSRFIVPVHGLVHVYRRSQPADSENVQ